MMRVLVLAAAMSVGGALQLTAAELPRCTIGLHLPIVSPLNRSGIIVEVDEEKGTYRVQGEDGLLD